MGDDRSREGGGKQVCPVDPVPLSNQVTDHLNFHQRSDHVFSSSRPLASEEETPGEGERLLAESLANSSQHDLMSPEPRRPQSLVLEQLPHLLGRLGQGSPSPPSPVSSLLPDLEEIRVSPCIAKKGHLNVLEEKSKGWKKRWVVVRRPYVFIFREER